MKTALIIGSTGLIGSQLLNSFRADYDKVIAFVKEQENT
jgi:NAD dependent epimerase/dehydratase family enzyme